MKKILLHSCCGPCSTVCIERLKENFDVTIFYCNPNIEPYEEFQHRKNEQKKVCEALGVGYVEDEYDNAAWHEFVRGLEGEKEGGARCRKCFEFRLARTAQFAKDHGFDLFATTLSVSPHKNSLVINEVGKSLEEVLPFWDEIFKKKDGYLRSIQLSRELNLYRQNYCGCLYSLAEARARGQRSESEAKV